MYCNSSSEENSAKHGWQFTVYTVVLLVLLCSSFVGNMCLFVRNYKQSQKWEASDWLLQRMAVFGLLNGLFNIGIYLSSFLSGRWLLGHVGCQLYGVTSSVLNSGWIWLLIVSLIERYKCVTMESDYASLFSVVNTKIITYGIVLWLSVLYLSPLYGWGEYSYLKGMLELEVGIKNCTALADLSAGENDSIIIEPVQRMSMTFFTDNGDSPIMQRMKEYFSTNENTAVRRHYFRGDAAVFSLRAYTQEALGCLWDSYNSEELHGRLQGLIQPGALSFQFSSCDLRVYIDGKNYQEYKGIYMMYQEMTTCGLDLSYVNHHVWTFALFVWTCTLFIPIMITLFILTKLLYHNNQNAAALQYYTNVLSNDVCHTQLVIITTILSLGCYVPHTVLQFHVLMRTGISTNSMFVANVLLFSTWSHLPLLEFLIIKYKLFSNSNCFYFCWLCACCPGCVEKHHSDYPFCEIDSRTILLEKRPSCNSATGYTSKSSLRRGVGIEETSL